MFQKNETQLSVEHENSVAKHYDGVRSKTSGASATDKGDVKTNYTLFECKRTGAPGSVPKRKPRFVKLMEKCAYEAYEEGLCPALAMRYYLPESPLSNNEGYVDFIVRPLGDDRDRELEMRTDGS